MARAQPAAPRRTTFDCPMDEDPALDAAFRASLAASRDMSRGVLAFLHRKDPHAQAAWLKETVERTKVMFQPWNMELLYVLATSGRQRFSQLQEVLGISSRTLSDKLQGLREAGLVDRQVFDEQPVRIEYQLTRLGRRVAALSCPLFAQLAHPERLGGAEK